MIMTVVMPSTILLLPVVEFGSQSNYSRIIGILANLVVMTNYLSIRDMLNAWGISGVFGYSRKSLYRGQGCFYSSNWLTS